MPGRARAPCHSVARALQPHTPGVSSDHSHCPIGTRARNPLSAEGADSGVSAGALGPSPVIDWLPGHWQWRIPGLGPRRSASGKPPPLVYLHKPIHTVWAEQA